MYIMIIFHSIARFIDQKMNSPDMTAITVYYIYPVLVPLCIPYVCRHWEDTCHAQGSNLHTHGLILLILIGLCLHLSLTKRKCFFTLSLRLCLLTLILSKLKVTSFCHQYRPGSRLYTVGWPTSRFHLDIHKRDNG